MATDDLFTAANGPAPAKAPGSGLLVTNHLNLMYTRLLHKPKDPLLPRSREQTPRKSVIRACGLSSLAVNLSYALFQPETPVFFAVKVCMGRNVMQLTGTCSRRAS